MGGTKLLAGAVDTGLSVHHRVQRTLTGLDQSAVLDAAVEAVEEARESAGGEIAAVGFGIPCLMDQRSGRGVIAVNLPLANVPFGAIMAERLGLPVTLVAQIPFRHDSKGTRDRERSRLGAIERIVSVAVVDQLSVRTAWQVEIAFGSEVAGVWTSFDDALEAGYERYGLDPFLVKEVVEYEEPRYFSRNITKCQ